MPVWPNSQGLPVACTRGLKIMYIYACIRRLWDISNDHYYDTLTIVWQCADQSPDFMDFR